MRVISMGLQLIRCQAAGRKQRQNSKGGYVMRIERNGVRYFSFGELATSMGLKPVTKVTNDKEKLKDQQEKFVNRHKCKACGQPMTWLQGSSVMTCINPECKGIKFTKEDPETGEKKVWYEPSFDLLDDLGTEIAGNIFSAKI